MIDIEHFITRINRTKAEVLRDLGEDPKSSMLSSYQAGRAQPSYAMCVKLLKRGMTVEELFGPEIWEAVKKTALLEAGTLPKLTDEECRRIVEHGLNLLNAEKGQ